MKITVDRTVTYSRDELCEKLGLNPKRVLAVQTDGFGVTVVMQKSSYEQELIDGGVG